ncbi:MAG: hypothetical protein AB7P21_03120 [Lautropia sp.]
MPTARLRRRRSQRGQAIVLGLCLLMIGALVVLLQFSAGQAVAAKSRLVNATDAAAYSTGVWRARAMNYYAYTNRAIVANEVAIAQAATMVSYAKYLERLTDNVNDVAQYVPYVGEISEALKEIAYWISELTQSTATLEVPLRSAHIAALVASQHAMFVATHPVVLSRIAAEVARENDRRFFAFTMPTSLDPSFGDFTRVWKDDDRGRLRDVVLRSLDGFSSRRDAQLPIDLPCMPVLARRGATELVRDHEAGFERWQAYDTLSLHAPGFLCRRREVLPLGWGAAEIAVDPKHELDALGTGGVGMSVGDVPGSVAGSTAGDAGKRDNPRAYGNASDEIWSSGSYRGIAAVREIDFDSPAVVAAKGRFPTLKVAVVGRIQDPAAVATAQAAGHGRGRIQPQDRFAGRAPAVMAAVSVAEVYFRRPPQSNERTEYASLYSPYWQVRLAEVPDALRVAAAGYLR